jgi:hypothetical protein
MTSRIVVRLDRWAAIVLAEGFDSAIANIPGAKTSESVPDTIRLIGEHLTKDVKGFKGDLVRKSLQEALFLSLGTRRRRVGHTFFLRRRGKGLLRCFLRLHLFNVAWVETGESFRAVAGTQKTFVQDMESVERLCQRIVDSAWRSQDIRGKLDQSSATKVINRIERIINS